MLLPNQLKIVPKLKIVLKTFQFIDKEFYELRKTLKINVDNISFD